MTTREHAEEKMRALLSQRPLRMLADGLALMDRKKKLDDAERFARRVLIDVICERSPAAEAAFQAWAESDDNDIRHASAAIIAAARRT